MIAHEFSGRIVRSLVIGLGTALVLGSGEMARAQMPQLHCVPTIQDQANPSLQNCIPASSVPQLGMLFPISSQLFVDKVTGGIGFGTTTPYYDVEVANPVSNGLGLGIKGNCSNATYVALDNTDPVGHTYYLASWGTLAGAGVLQGKFSIFDTTAGVHRFIIDANGNIGIGPSIYFPAHPLVVSDGIGPDAYCDGNTWVNSCGRQGKESISPLKHEDYTLAIDQLDKTNVVKYRYKNDKSAKERLGLIAEDVPDVLADPDRKGISTADAIGFLMAVVKAQQEEIRSLKADVTALNDRQRK